MDGLGVWCAWGVGIMCQVIAKNIGATLDQSKRSGDKAPPLQRHTPLALLPKEDISKKDDNRVGEPVGGEWNGLERVDVHPLCVLGGQTAYPLHSSGMALLDEHDAVIFSDIFAQHLPKQGDDQQPPIPIPPG